MYREVYVHIFRKYKWRKVALLGENANNIPTYHTSLRQTIEQNDIEVAFQSQIPENVVSVEKVSEILLQLK